jgi:glycosyltransferase involved in cell wall biosynthesis
MRLLYTLTSYPPAIGGAQLLQHLLAQELNQFHNVQVISHWSENRTDWLLGTTLKAPTQSLDYMIDHIAVHQLGITVRDKLKLLPYVPIYYPFMDLALNKISPILESYLLPYAQKADLIHNVRIGREGLTYASYQVARKLDIPFVFTPVHHPRWVGWRYRIYLKIYQQANAVIVLTNAEKQTLIELGVKSECIFVTGVGPVLASSSNPLHFRKQHKIDSPMVLFLGQHYTYKGYRQLLEATTLVWQKFPETEFVFIGPPVGKSESDFQQFRDRRIHRLGKVSLQDKTNALAACDLLCVPSSQESFGAIYTEAWYFGKPVIGCDIPAVAEVIDDGVNGYVVSQTPEAIAARICDLLSDSNRAQQMGQAGKQKVENYFTWDKLGKRTLAIYEQILSGNN